MPRSRYLDDTDVGTAVWPVDGGLGADVPGCDAVGFVSEAASLSFNLPLPFSEPINEFLRPSATSINTLLAVPASVWPWFSGSRAIWAASWNFRMSSPMGLG
jgi:hypothetical protein